MQFLSTEILQKLGESLLKLIQLKHLRLDLGYAKTVNNKGVEALANAIQKLSGLSVLDLDFSGNKDIDDVEKVAETLRCLPSLYSVQLRCIGCPCLKQNQRSLCSLFDALGDMKNIKEVLLSIPYNKINEQEVNDLKQKKILTISWF